MITTRLGKVFLFFAFAALFAQGCASPAGPGRCRVFVVMQASRQVNPSNTGEALPTTVRFYQLKDAANLRKASYEDLWLRGEEVLGADLADTLETIIYPSDRQTQVIPIKDEAVYFAAAAFFRSPEGTRWRTFARLPDLGTVERCTDDKPGGPYYFILSGTTMRGSKDPPPVAGR